jgi:hypothetical protein
MAALMDEELVVVAAYNEHLVILISLLAMIAEDDKPAIGGSASGRRKSKERDTRVHAVWCLTQWLTMTYGFWHAFFGMAGSHIISMCCGAPMCSRSLSKEIPL